MAPPAHLVPGHMETLLRWLRDTDEHPLAAACVFHFEFEFIHPFLDGNGRMGHLWQAVILASWKPVLAWLPVEATVLSRRQEYYDCLGQAGVDGEATVFLEFMLDALLEAVTAFVKELESERTAPTVHSWPTLELSEEQDK